MNKSSTAKTVYVNLMKYSSFLILMHSSPDGDTIGSALALRNILRATGRTAEAACADPIPERLKFMCSEPVDISRLADYEPECIITTDVADAGLLGALRDRYEGKIDIMIDHHARNMPIGALCFNDSSCAACGEMIFDIGYYAQIYKGQPMSSETAKLLYCAISSDTGGFRYSNTTPHTHRIASELLKYDIESHKLDELLHTQTTKKAALIAAEVMRRARFYENDRIGVVYVDEEMTKQYDVRDNDIGDIVNMTRCIDTVEIAVSVKASADGEYKVSFRTRAADASALASRYGGGGHIRAAGCTVRARSIDDAINDIVARCVEILKAG